MTDSLQQRLALSPEAALRFLDEHATALLARRPEGRVVLGLAGGPGVGKSTLAVRLVAARNAAQPGSAAYVPMDGFHMRQARLEALGLATDKGAPQTFEAADFVAFLASLKQAGTDVVGPSYSRKIEDVVPGALLIPAEARLLVVEGNYLLLDATPWHQVRPLLDSAVFIDLPRDTVRRRLLQRHAAEGLFSAERNEGHVERVDLANYDLVAGSRPRADIALDLITEH